MAFSPIQSTAGRFGTQLGSSTGSFLEALAQNKVQQLDNNKKVRAWENLQGVDPNTARALVDLGINPNDFLKSLMQYGHVQNFTKGDNNPNNILQALQAGSGTPQMQSRQEPAATPFFHQVVQSTPQKPLTAAQEKLQMDIKDNYANLKDLVSTMDSIDEILDSGKADLGLYSTVGAAISPKLALNDETQELNSLIGHAINLQTAAEKGLMSKYRIKNLEKDKVSLNQGIKANKSVSKRIRQKALDKIREIQRDYSKLGLGNFDEIELPKGSANKVSFEAGSIIDKLPEPSSREFYSLPEGWGAEEDGIIYQKQGDGYITKRVEDGD